MTMEQTLELYEPQPGSTLALKSCPFCGCTHILYEEYIHAAGVRYYEAIHTKLTRWENRLRAAEQEVEHG